MSEAGEISELLGKVNAGEPGATDALAEAIHDDLRAMARRHLVRDLGRDMAGATIQPTILANDTLLKLIRQRQKYDNAGHLFAIASRLMMRLLIDYHRERKAAKRGGGAVRVSLDPEGGGQPRRESDPNVESVNDALDSLAKLDARKADVVRYRILWNMTTEETARALGVSVATVERDWAFSRSWLARELAQPG
jgi:RNA polymerase sigma factor (TIGR02999 family)